MTDQLAVLFPGVGYHCDKPLLYCLSAEAHKDFNFSVALRKTL